MLAVLALDLFTGVAGPVVFLFGFYGVILWMALAYWALKDARARAESPSMHFFALFVNLLVPILGLFVYLLVRPSLTLADRQAMALEAEALAGPVEESSFTGPASASASR